MEQLKPLSFVACMLVAMLCPDSSNPVFAQVGPDMDAIFSNQRAAEEARRKERGERRTTGSESERKMRDEIRAEMRAATRASHPATVAIDDEVGRLRSELTEARQTIAVLTSERDALRRAIESTTRPAP